MLQAVSESYGASALWTIMSTVSIPRPAVWAAIAKGNSRSMRSLDFRRAKWFEKFEAVPERVRGVKAIVTFERLVGDDGDVHTLQMAGERLQLAHQKCRMRLLCRPKVLLDTEVNA